MEEIKPRLRTRDEISELAPELCVDCKGSVKQWDETDDEIVFQCVDCKRFYSIPFDPMKLNFYFSY